MNDFPGKWSMHWWGANNFRNKCCLNVGSNEFYCVRTQQVFNPIVFSKRSILALQSYFLNYKPLVLSGGRSFDFWVSEWLLPPWCLFYLQYSLSFLEQPLPKLLLVILPSMWRRFTPGTRLMCDELIHSHFETNVSHDSLNRISIL